MGVESAAEELLRVLASRQLRCAFAESCTGGLAASSLTAIPGASAVLWGGVVAYSNESKTRLLGVPRETIDRFGAVSREVAKAMAEGAIKASGADLSVSITGIAGPDGGSPEKPVGLVWFGYRLAGADGQAFEESAVFGGDRKAIRSAAAERAMLGAARLARDL